MKKNDQKAGTRLLVAEKAVRQEDTSFKYTLLFALPFLEDFVTFLLKVLLFKASESGLGASASLAVASEIIGPEANPSLPLTITGRSFERFHRASASSCSDLALLCSAGKQHMVLQAFLPVILKSDASDQSCLAEFQGN